MPLLNIDLSKAPDVQPVIESGVYDCLVKGKPDLKPASTGNGSVLHITLAVNNQGTQHGRTTRDFISTMLETNIKRFLLSCGVPRNVVEDPAGVDTDLSDGRVCKVVIGSTMIEDKATGTKRPGNKVLQYLIPGDQGFDAPGGPGPLPALS